MQLLEDGNQAAAATVITRSARARIADATRKSHEALHTHPVLSRLMAPDLSAPEYADILSHYQAFYEKAEAIRGRHYPSSDLSFLPELQLLQLDLHAQKRPPPVRHLQIDTTDQALGMLYVLHGTRFGANTIYKNLKVVLPRHGHRFFGSASDQKRWRLLLSDLETSGAHPAQLLEIIAGAQATFKAFDAEMRAL